MAIKVAYIFLKTFTQIKNIPLYACSGFELNQNSPIKALGKKYFILQDDNNIKIEFLEDKQKIYEFELPDNLTTIIYSTDILPNYQLPAVSY